MRIFHIELFILNESTSHMYITRAKVETKAAIDVPIHDAPSAVHVPSTSWNPGTFTVFVASVVLLQSGRQESASASVALLILLPAVTVAQGLFGRAVSTIHCPFISWLPLRAVGQSPTQVYLSAFTLNLAFTGMHALLSVVEAAVSAVHFPAASW